VKIVFEKSSQSASLASDPVWVLVTFVALSVRHN
jgi:hypothetical protein